MLTITKSLIFLSFILAFAVALQDGDQIAFKTHGSFFNAQYQYLNGDSVHDTLGMAPSTDYTSFSGTWWEAHKLSDGSFAFRSLGHLLNNPETNIYLNGNTYTGAVDLAASTDASGTHWAAQTLPDGTVALKCTGSHLNPNFVYLNVDTYIGKVNLASGTGASGSH